MAAKQARREGGFLAQDPEQHVLAADVLVIESIRFLFGAVENVLRLVGKRNLDGGRQFLARALVRLYCRARFRVRKAGGREQAGRGSPVRAKDPEQEVFGVDRRTAKFRHLEPREEQRAPGLCREAIKHGAAPRYYSLTYIRVI